MLLRTYENDHIFGDISNIKIWEAARATSAASTLFPPIQLGNHGDKFVDGALNYNNPVFKVYQEARSLWPNDILMMVSIGTGNTPGQSLEGSLPDLLAQIVKLATETEKTAKEFEIMHPGMTNPGPFFRFNVT